MIQVELSLGLQMQLDDFYLWSAHSMLREYLMQQHQFLVNPTMKSVRLLSLPHLVHMAYRFCLTLKANAHRIAQMQPEFFRE
jgi:hypothetical protein